MLSIADECTKEHINGSGDKSPMGGSVQACFVPFFAGGGPAGAEAPACDLPCEEAPMAGQEENQLQPHQSAHLE